MRHHHVGALYERHARAFDCDRDRALVEKPWLDRFLALVPSDGTVLDLGCGMAEPMAAYILASGYRVVGVDTSPSLIDLCRARYPNEVWLVGDLRNVTFSRQFDGVLAWDSFFHLHADDQRGVFERFAAHARPAAPLMFTSGTSAGEAVGEYCGDALYHASLNPAEYEQRLASCGFTVHTHLENDPDCGRRTVWLATRDTASPGDDHSRA